MPQRTSAYISQFDNHIGELTVRETFDFAARCQGAGYRPGMCVCIPASSGGYYYFNLCPEIVNILGQFVFYVMEFLKKHLFLVISSFADLLRELAKREKEQNIHPDPDIDAYMKVGCA